MATARDELSRQELYARRQALGLTQQQLADELGVRANTLARWERGEARMWYPRLIRARLEQLEAGHRSQP